METNIFFLISLYVLKIVYDVIENSIMSFKNSWEV